MGQALASEGEAPASTVKGDRVPHCHAHYTVWVRLGLSFTHFLRLLQPFFSFSDAHVQQPR